MEFRTRVDIGEFERKIDHGKRGLSLGSCFAENIATKLHRAKFQVVSNPFGVLFNPASIAAALERLHSGQEYRERDLVQNGDIYCNFDFHGSFSSTDPERALEKMNRAVADGAAALHGADYVIITFGTAWVYELTESAMAGGASGGGRIVANCHKFLASAFRRRRLTVEEIVCRYGELLDGVLSTKNVIFTVSPVRHVKDGLPENALSKAILLGAVHELVGSHGNAGYFPAFEIVNDELRDYRFYAEDMVHPSPVAVDYIWERFGGAAFSPATQALVAETEKIAAAMEHRPFNPGSESHLRFLASMRKQVELLAGRCPQADFSAELDHFSRNPESPEP